MRSPEPLPALGFGQADDECLLEQYHQLDAGCRNAIDDVLLLREEYEEESAAGPCVAGVFVFALLLGALTTLCCVRGCASKRQRKVRALLTAIHADPALKEQLQQKGVRVPGVRAAAAGEETPCQQRCRFALRLVAAFALSFLLVQLAAAVTVSIATSMVHETEEGDEEVPAPWAVLLIFISLLLAELALLVAVKSVVRQYSQRRSPPAASAAPQNNNNNNNSGSSSGSGSGSGPMTYVYNLSQPMLALLQRRSPSGDGYTPLLREEAVDMEEADSAAAPSSGGGRMTQLVTLPVQLRPSAPPQPTIITAATPSYVQAQALSTVSMI